MCVLPVEALHPAPALVEHGNFLDARGHYSAIERDTAVGREAFDGASRACGIRTRRPVVDDQHGHRPEIRFGRVAIFCGESDWNAAGEAYCDEVFHGRLPLFVRPY